jgi:hypothetical protein
MAEKEEMSDDEYPSQDHFLSGVLLLLYKETGNKRDFTREAVIAMRELEETKLEREKALQTVILAAAEAAAQAQAQARAAAAEAEAAAQAEAEAAAQAEAAARAAAAEAPPPCYREGDSLQMHTSEGAAPPPYTASIGVTSV